MQVHLSLAREDQAALTRAAKDMDVKRLALNADEVKGEQRQLVTEFYMRCAELKARACRKLGTSNIKYSQNAAARVFSCPTALCASASPCSDLCEMPRGPSTPITSRKERPSVQECVCMAQGCNASPAQAHV